MFLLSLNLIVLNAYVQVSLPPPPPPTKKRVETEGGGSFAVSATRLWNSTPIEIRKLDSVACFKKTMFAKIFKEQQCLHHFII